VSKEIAPGASYEGITDFTIYGYPQTQITLHIEGVDFGIDSDISNNAYTTDVVILASEDLEFQKFTISPNPSSDFITISGLISEIKSITITDLSCRKIQISHSDLTKIDISALQAGQYWIQINTKTDNYRQPFIKL
jgi:hypothetical protein